VFSSNPPDAIYCRTADNCLNQNENCPHILKANEGAAVARVIALEKWQDNLFHPSGVYSLARLPR
jgi:hypothetical protein